MPFSVFRQSLLGFVLLCATACGLSGADTPVDLNQAVGLVPPEYRHRLVQRMSLAEENRDGLLGAIVRAEPGHREALAFLLVNMPEPDLKLLTGDFLLRNVELAYDARGRNGWATAVPMEIFLNDVLPYANLNERRDDWRADFVARFSVRVKECKSLGEAAQVLNREVFKALKVSYHATKRRKPDQSPYESAECRYASCSGLSILLVDACRAVGVPARVVGTPLWSDGSGNHTWVEVWDGQWRFVGAAEPGEFNQTWFADLAAKADASKPQNRIYAASFRQTGIAFPLVWDPKCEDYAAIDVTGYYVHRRKLIVNVAADAAVEVRQAGRLIARSQGDRAEFELAAETDYAVRAVLLGGGTIEKEVRLGGEADVSLELRTPATTLPTTARAADNEAAPGKVVDELRAWLAKPSAERAALAGEAFARVPLRKEQAEQVRQALWDDHAATVRAERAKEWNDEAITLGEHTLKWKQRHFGNKPKGGWNLYLSLHGGGGAPAAVNTQQWENQIKLYQPADSLYVAPRAPTDNWNLWHEGHMDPLLERFLEDAFVLGDVNPDRVYIMGYSAGGDGVYQLAPRMADRWAAAAMMAGHPNDASPLGLRNIGFTIHVGALDNAYDRNKKAAEWKQKLDDLQKADPKGYAHEVKLHEGRGHWMNLEDKEALDWMAKFTRDPIPAKVVWKQSPVTHDRFYWLAMPAAEAKGGQEVVASREGQNIEVEQIEGVKVLTVLLNDAMLDLDKPVTVKSKGKELFNGIAPRTIERLQETLSQRGDPASVFPAAVTVRLGDDAAK